MSRTSTAREKREAFLPQVARVFADMGYRRATTSALAKACGVRENVLYRLWPDKKAMFLAAIEYVFEFSRARWSDLAARDGETQDAAKRLLDFEATHHGEFGHYRIVFAGLNETDDPDIRAALRRMYRHFVALLEPHLRAFDDTNMPPAALRAWAVIGLGTVASIGRELRMLDASTRRALMTQIGTLLLKGAEQ